MSNIVIDDYKDKRLDDTFFCVEATSNEVQSNNAHMMLHAIQDSQKIWAVRKTGTKESISFDTPRDLAQFLFNQGEDDIAVCPYNFSYGPKDAYVYESNLSCEDMAIAMTELASLYLIK